MTTSTDDPLVTTDWLAARLDDPKVKIIDASYKMPGVLPLPSDDYLGGHIPGAVFFDVSAIADPNDPRPHMYPDAEQFARDVSALGISSGDTVVAYDSGAWVAAPRAWWMFLSFGHPNVKVLDGGLQKWLREGRPTHSGKVVPKIITGTGVNSTLYKIGKVIKDELGVDAICIDDESVYNSASIVRFGAMINKLNMHMSLCPFAKHEYWKDIISRSQNGLVDAVYVQCYDGGVRNAPGQWKDSLATNIPVYPIFLCRGAFSTCSSTHNSKTPDEIKAEMIRFKKGYPGMTGGAIWQMADVKDYIRRNCAVQDPESGSAASISQYLTQLRNSLKEGL